METIHWLKLWAANGRKALQYHFQLSTRSNEILTPASPGVLGCGGKSEWWMIDDSPGSGSGPGWVPALHIPPSVWVQLSSSLGALSGLNQSQPPPIPSLCDLNQSEIRIEDRRRDATDSCWHLCELRKKIETEMICVFNLPWHWKNSQYSGSVYSLVSL